MEIYKRFWKKYKLLFILATSCVFFEAVCDLLQPTIMSHIIDNGVRSKNMQTVLSLGLVALFVTLLGAVFAVTRNILASKVSQSFGADLRYELFKKIVSMPISNVDKIESGSLITRMTNDTAQVTQFYNGLMRIFFKAPLTCIGSIILAVSINPKLSIILFIAIGIVAFFIVNSMRMSYARYIKVQRAMDKVNTVIQEYLMGVRLVKAFGRFKDEENRFEAVNEQLSDTNISAQRVISVFSPLMSLTINIGIAVIIYLGSLMFTKKQVQVGQIVAFTNYMTQILGSLMMITNVFNTFVRTKASTERINEILSQKDEELQKSDKVCNFAGKVVFDDVSFAYPNGSGEPVLKNLSFRIEEGETIAVIGPTGSGKSTIAWLLLGFYNATGGAIYIEGKNINTIKKEDLQISVAPQQSMLFSGSVAENILWGNKDASKDELYKSARIAQAKEFIEKMPCGFDSILGQGGVNISGGQKQRISIARAIIKNAKVMILDDCTSALDAITESKIKQGLKELDKKQTILMITQRIGTAMTADKILVLENGEAVGFGTHEDLMKSCGTYSDIYESQIGTDGEKYA